MIAVLREAARQRGVTLLRLIQIAAGVDLAQSAVIEYTLAYAGAAGTLTKSRRQWQEELGASRRDIDKAHKAMPLIGITVGTTAVQKRLRVTCYQVDWDTVKAQILAANLVQGEPTIGYRVSQSVGTGCANQLVQGEPTIWPTGCPPICSSSSREKETQESEESLTTTTSSSTPSAYEMLVNAGVYPTIANRFRDKDPVEIRRLIRYANEHGKVPSAFIAAALVEGYVAPMTQDELYYDFIER